MVNSEVDCAATPPGGSLEQEMAQVARNLEAYSSRERLNLANEIAELAERLREGRITALEIVEILFEKI